MRAIFVIFDSLNRHYLEPYGSQSVKTPNFQRLAKRTVTFDSHYVGSLPCMPARRDIHTGRLSFLHRSWGPLEPFDPSVFGALRSAGVYSHLITDHVHYFEEGSGNYHTKYDTYDYYRGQEGDKWAPTLNPPMDAWNERYHVGPQSLLPGSLLVHNLANRERIVDESDFPSTKCFSEACDFVDHYADSDNWILQVETFDTHEPFVAPVGYRAAYQSGGEGPAHDWPPYDRYVDGVPENESMQANYKALVDHCDTQLGRLLDKMDALNMWDDTMLIVTTDHGFLLGEHEWWAKNRMPTYEEIANIPLFIHHPLSPSADGTRRSTLTQTPDLMPTILDFFGAKLPEAVSKSICPAIHDPETQIHEAIIYGYFGGAVNLTDGRYTYFRYPEHMTESDLNEYTLMPAHMLASFSRNELTNADLCTDLDFSRGFPVLRVPVQVDSDWYNLHGPGALRDCQSAIYDLGTDPSQLTPIHNEGIESKLVSMMVKLMERNNAPSEAYHRLGFEE